MTKEALQIDLQAVLDADDSIQLEILAREAVETYPDASFGYYFLGEALIRLDSTQYNAIETCLIKALELEPKKIPYLLRLAQLKEVQGQLSMAQVIWDRLLEVAPTHLDALLGKAVFVLQFYKNYAESIRLFTAVLEQEPQHTIALQARAEAYVQTDAYELALLDLDKILAEGFNEAALIQKITCFNALRKTSATIELYQQLLASFPDNFNHLFSYGKTLFDLKKYTQAADQLLTAKEYLEEDDLLFYTILGDACLADNRYQTAIDAFKQCLVLGANDGEIYLQLFKAYVALKQYDKLADIEARVKPLFVDHANLAQRFQIEQAHYYINQGNLDQAENILIPLAQEKTLRQKDAYYALGVVYHQQNDLAKAYRFLKAAKNNQQAKAASYIHQHFGIFLKKLQQQALQANQEAILQNKKAPFLQQLLKKVWRFKDLESQQLQAFSSNEADNIKASLQYFSIIFSHQGALFITENGTEHFTYRIKKQAKNGVLLEMLPLDNSPLFLSKIEQTTEGITLSRRKGEQMHLVAKDIDNLASETLTYFKQVIDLDSIDFLDASTIQKLEKML